MLSTIFSAVPAFIRVEPATTSGPVSTTMASSAALSSGAPAITGDGNRLRSPASRVFERRTVKGVRPLAARPRTIILCPHVCAAFPLRRGCGVFVGSAAPARALRASSDHELDHRGPVLNVGGHSAASSGGNASAGSRANVNQAPAVSRAHAPPSRSRSQSAAARA